MPIAAYILVALFAYLLGSIPTGYLVAKAKGIDIRSVGSGNIGATNAMRVLGKTSGILVLLFDTAKGSLACSLGAFIGFHIAFPPSGLHSVADSNSVSFAAAVHALTYCPILAGIFVILGHNYTCWLGFKGGKGIATTAGVYFALAPLSVSIALGVWIILFVTTRYVSIASIGAAAALPTAVWLTQGNLLLSIVTTALGAMAIYKHKSNIQRLMAGTENRASFGKGKSAT